MSSLESRVHGHLISFTKLTVNCPWYPNFRFKQCHVIPSIIQKVYQYEDTVAMILLATLANRNRRLIRVDIWFYSFTSSLFMIGIKAYCGANHHFDHYLNRKHGSATTTARWTSRQKSCIKIMEALILIGLSCGLCGLFKYSVSSSTAVISIRGWHAYYLALLKFQCDIVVYSVSTHKYKIISSATYCL